MKFVLGLAALLLLGALPARAQSAAETEACHNQGATPEIEQCLGKELAVADRHLNAAYQTALKRLSGKAVEDLRAAQRAWLQYREKRCAYVTPTQGTIGRIIYPDCMVTMTSNRAEELDNDAKGLGD